MKFADAVAGYRKVLVGTIGGQFSPLHKWA